MIVETDKVDVCSLLNLLDANLMRLIFFVRESLSLTANVNISHFCKVPGEENKIDHNLASLPSLL